MNNKGSSGAWFFFGVITTVIFLAISEKSVFLRLIHTFNWSALAAIGTLIAVWVSLYLAYETFSREDREKLKEQKESKALMQLLCKPAVKEIRNILNGFLELVEERTRGFHFDPKLHNENIFEKIEVSIQEPDSYNSRHDLIREIIIVARPHFQDLSTASFSTVLTQIKCISDLDNDSQEELLKIISAQEALLGRYLLLEKEVENSPKVFTPVAAEVACYLIGTSVDTLTILNRFISRNFND